MEKPSANELLIVGVRISSAREANKKNCGFVDFLQLKEVSFMFRLENCSLIRLPENLSRSLYNPIKWCILTFKTVFNIRYISNIFILLEFGSSFEVLKLFFIVVC